MIQPYNDRVVGPESAQVLPCFQTETYRAGDNGEGRETKESKRGRGKGRDEMQGTQAASIMWFGAEAICTYCSP